MNQVAMKLGKRGDQVMLTKDKRLVDPTAMAAIYTNAKLVAKVVSTKGLASISRGNIDQ